MTRELLRTVGVVVAVLTLLTGAAAATPTSGAPDDSTEAIGPPGGLPDPVPDFVTSILDSIAQFLEGTLDASPGEVVSSAAENGGAH